MVARSTNAFVSNIGVNTHWNNSSGPAADPVALISDLAKILEFPAIRDRAPPILKDIGYTNASQILSKLIAGGLKRYVMLANTGMVGAVRVPAAVADQVASIVAFVKANPLIPVDVESCNEPHNFPISYAGLTDTAPNFAASAKYTSDLKVAIRAEPTLANVRVIGPSWSPQPAADPGADLKCAHIYPYMGGLQAGEPLPNINGQIAGFKPGAWIVTETNYSDAKFGGTMATDATTSAKLLLSEIAQIYRLGAVGAYLYDLYDDSATPDAANAGWGAALGLFDYHRNIKPVGQAVANLTGFLKGSTALSTLDTTTVWAEPVGAYLLPLQRDGKTWDVLVWNEPLLWDYGSHTQAEVTPLTTTVTLPFTASQVVVHDPITGSEVTMNGAMKSVTVRLLGYPLVLRVTPA